MANIAEYFVSVGADIQGLSKAQIALKAFEQTMASMGKTVPKQAQVISSKQTAAFDSAGNSVNVWVDKVQTGASNFTEITRRYDENSKKWVASNVRMSNAMTQVGKDMANLFTRALKTIPIWLALRAGVQAVTGAFSEGFQFLIEWEHQMAQIRIVGGSTSEELKILSNSLLELATNLGISHKELGTTAKLYAQAGFAIKEIVPLMEATAKLSLISGRSMSQSMEDLTSIMKAFKIETGSVINIVDSLENVELKHAVTTDTLVAALRNSASTAASMGISFERLQGVIAAVSTVTRESGSRIGNAFKTIFSRMSTSAIEAIQSIAKVPVFINAVGQATFENTGNLRDMGQVLDGLAVSYQTLSSAEKADLANKVAGKTRLNELNALLLNYNEAIEAEADALFSAGKAQAAVSILTDTTKNRMTALTQSWNTFVDSIANTSGIKSSISVLTGLFENLSKVFDKSKAATSEALKGHDKTIQSLNKEYALNQAQLDLYLKLKNTQASLKANPALKETSEVMAQANINAAKLAGIQVPDWVVDFNTLLEYIEGNLQDIVKTSGQITVKINREEIQKELATVSGDIVKILSPSIADSFKPTGFNVITDWVNEIKEKLVKSFQAGTLSAEQLEAALKKGALNKQQYDAILEKLKEQENIQNKLGAASNKEAEAVKKVSDNLQKAQSVKFKAIVSEADIQEQVRAIEERGLINNEDSISLIKEKLSVISQYSQQVSSTTEALEDESSVLGESLEKQRASLELELLKAEASRKIALEKIKEQASLEVMKMLGASEVDLAKQKLEYAKEHKDVEEIARTESDLQLKTLEEQVDIRKQIIDHNIELLRIQGANNVQILETKLALLKNVETQGSMSDVLKTQLELEREIVKERTNQNKLSSEAITLWKIQKTFGEQAAVNIAKVLSGKSDITSLTDVERKLLAKKFSGTFEQQEAGLSTTTGGISQNLLAALQPAISLKKIPQVSFQDAIAIQSKEPLATLPKIDVGGVTVNVKVDSENIKAEILKAITEEFKNPNSEFSKLDALKIENF